MKYALVNKILRTVLLLLIAGWAVFCIARYFNGQIVIWDVLVLVALDRMRLWTTPSSGNKASRAPAHDTRASSLGDTAYRHLRRRNGESSEAEWEAQRQAREAAEAIPPYISPANISATCVTLQPTEDGRELGDHGLILSVLAALRSADALPLPDRGVLKQLVYEMAYRFAADSGMEERDRAGILAERKAERRMDAYANHCQGIQELRSAQAASENASASVSRTAIDAYALRVDEFARRVPQPQTEALLQLHKTALAGGMKPIRITDDQQFNPNSPEALDALLDAAGAPDPRDLGDALAYSFVGLDPAKPGSDRTVFAISLADKAPCEAMHMFLIERARQIQAEGCKPEHDDGYIHGELARAAAAYALPEEARDRYNAARLPSVWPWGSASWKPSPDDRLREIVKAGALLLAEAERLIRAKAQPR